MKRKTLVILLMVLVLPVLPVTSLPPLREGEYWQSTVELLNLNVDGSINPVNVNCTKEFTFITEVVFHLTFEVNQLAWEDFGDGNGTGPLANGSIGFISGNLQPFVVTSNDNLLSLSRTATLFTDEHPIGSRHIVSPILYGERIPDFGLLVVKNGTEPALRFQVRDDIPSYVTTFFAVVGGGLLIPNGGSEPVPFSWNPIDIINQWASALAPIAPFAVLAGAVAIAMVAILKAVRR